MHNHTHVICNVKESGCTSNVRACACGRSYQLKEKLALTRNWSKEKAAGNTTKSPPQYTYKSFPLYIATQYVNVRVTRRQPCYSSRVSLEGWKAAGCWAGDFGANGFEWKMWGQLEYVVEDWERNKLYILTHGWRSMSILRYVQGYSTYRPQCICQKAPWKQQRVTPNNGSESIPKNI